MREHVQSPHQIDLLVRWLKKRVEDDEGERWREWVGDRARDPLWLCGKRGVWGYRKEANGEHGFSVSGGLPSLEASHAEWWYALFHSDAMLFGSLTMYAAPDNSTDIVVECKDEGWNPYFTTLLQEMRGPSLAVDPPQHQEPSQHERAKAETPEPWDVIPNPKDRSMVEMWNKGVPTEQIAEKFKMKKKTVLNRICDLRRLHGDVVVPYRRTPSEEYSW